MAEFIARQYLRINGFKILTTRYITGKHSHRAEIDIIAKRKNLMIFVEVKQRPNLNLGLEAITTKQMQRLRNAAETYMMKMNWNKDARFDAIIVSGVKIFWIKNCI